MHGGRETHFGRTEFYVEFTLNNKFYYTYLAFVFYSFISPLRFLFLVSQFPLNNYFPHFSIYGLLFSIF